MANEEIHGLPEDEELSPFARSLVEKIVNNENLKAMNASKLRRKRMGIMGRVPDVVREQNEEAYSPTTISIGPLHREKERLQDMEPLKLSYTHSLLGRVGEFKKTMELCAAAVLKMEKDVWNSYDPGTLPPNTQENVRWLAEVILIDACFIIELLWRYYDISTFYDEPFCFFDNQLGGGYTGGISDHPVMLQYLANFSDDHDHDDPNWLYKYFVMRRDLVLLENQIPFSVLKKLFKLTVEKIPSQSGQRYSLAQLVFGFFLGTRGGPHLYEARNVENRDVYHILHLLHIYLQPQQSNHIQVNLLQVGDRKYDEIEKMERRMKYSATELRLAGVKLKRARHTNLFNIKFTTSFSFISCWFMFRKGHFEIPHFIISGTTESFLRNLIALEQSCPSIGSLFTSFAFFMDLLIDTPEDVKLLKKARIIDNGLGSNEEVARLFNGICSNATATSGFHYSKQYKEAMYFCNHPCRVATKDFRQDYFGNPWTGISVIAAIILFVLTFISTLYTMLSYYYT